MSEQINQLNAGVKIGPKFEYFNLGNVTIKSLAQNNIIPKKDYGGYNIKRPDGLLVDRTDKKNPKVIAVVEYKDKKKFQTEKDVNDAVKQCNDYAQVLGAIFGVATDTNVSVWINPKAQNPQNEYTDEKGNIRSYEFIRDDEQQKISSNFYFHLQNDNQIDPERFSDEVKETFNLITRIIESDIGESKSDLKKDDTVDPTNLAKSVWQDIYVATGKEPTKCLYNVVELFIFKFLSDLGVLESDYNFSKIVEKCQNDEKDALEYYAENIRPRIRKLFPSERESGTGLDGTTIINGTIFVEGGKAVLSTASLFKKSIEKYEKFGPLKNIDKSFKIRLYEEFLKRDSGVKGMGQFFTPRKIVGNIVEMAKVENLKDGARVCDPFCGVGGFPLEVMTERHNKDFQVSGGKIKQNIHYFGFDKGNDSDAERTIILAKANMLIYLSDLVKSNNTITKEFARVFNETFKLKTGTLGTLADVAEKEDEKYDLIITNPPYVTSGSSILKDEIKNDSEKLDFYRINAMGVEGLAIEWIVRKLKKGGKAFIVVPDGIFNRLNDNKLRKFIMDECYINGVISLPINTFFTTPKKTYILAITKKDKKEDRQIKPVFTYLVTDIGETLDVYRFDTGKSDLESAKKLFRMFEGNENYFTTDDKRCKIQSFSKFEEEVNNYWTVDRWWTKEEKIELGIEELEERLSIDEFLGKTKQLRKKLQNIETDIEKQIYTTGNIKYENIQISKYFNIHSGDKLRKIHDHVGKYPIIGSQTTNDGVIAYTDNPYFKDCNEDNLYVTFGDHTRYFKVRNTPFSNTDAVKILQLKEEYKNTISLEYVLYLWKKSIPSLGYARHWSLAKNVFINIPISESGEFDLEKQREVAQKYEKIEKIKNDLIQELEYLESVKIEI